MNNKVFLDTNIVADLLDSNRPNHRNSLGLVEELIKDDTAICISEDMISTLYYITKDKKATLDFFKNVIFVDWEVLSFGKELLQDAVELSIKEDQDLEDILQCLCAKINGCNALITNDKLFYDCGIEIQGSDHPHNPIS